MKPAAAVGPDHDARIRRSEYLASNYPFAAEVLTFYRYLADFQKRLYAKLPRAFANRNMQPEGQLRSELDLGPLLPDFPELLALLQQVAPAPVKEVAREIEKRSALDWNVLLCDFWIGGAVAERDLGRPAERGLKNDEASLAAESLREFILRAFLQPCAEFLAARMSRREVETTFRVCPLCGSPPLLGVLRPEGDGAKRYLACSFCLREWEFRRIFCAACGEDAEGKLPVFVAEQFPHIRVESCGKCRFFIRTIDLTKDGHAVPVVDDLGAIPLSLWAEEHGYRRLHPNLLGT